MGGSVIPVAVGQQATQLSGATPDNYTIYNSDSKNAIWLSNRNSVTPNNGMRLGPLGTSHWAKESGLAFACVDTGVTSPVSVNVSNDITEITNPVDVATATAAALLAQGVPNVLVTNTLLQQTLAPGGSVDVDVSGQASVRVTILGQAAGNAVLQVDPYIPGGITLAFVIGTIDNASHTALGAWEIPVSDFTHITFVSPAGNPPMTIEVVGSNRVIAQHRQLGNNYTPRQLIFVGNFLLNTSVQFTPNDGVTDIDTRFNGPVKLMVHNGNGNSINANGFFLFASYAALNSAGAGPLITTVLVPNVTGNAMIDWYHPPVPVRWSIFPGFSANGVSVDFTVVPAGGGF